MNKNTGFKAFSLYLVVFAIIILSLLFSKNASLLTQTSVQDYTYNTLVNDLSNNELENISSISIQTYSETPDLGVAIVGFYDGTRKKIELPSVSTFMELLHKSSIDKNIITTLSPSKSKTILSIILPIILITVIGIAILFMIMNQIKEGGGSKVLSFGKSRAKLFSPENQKPITFNDVAGLKEEKSDLEETVEFLKEPKKFTDIGARIPKGVLLVGPPGTGKTLLARAIAGEAGVPFFSISGSDFVEMFVGVGASRVRDLFEEAKKNKPCLIFIDEIDAVGRRRGAGLGGGHDEREQTLNQLLVEMDGFSSNQGIIIIAATNRPDILDPALLRPGRFDRQIVIGTPDVKGREEILNIHAKNKKISEDVDLSEIAKTTSGFTGADLENLLNESALLAARKNKEFIENKDIQKAFIKVGVGTEKKSKIVSEKERKITAYHEAGHAIIFEKLAELDSVHIISIIPTGMAGGYTMPLPSDKSYLSKKYMEQDIVSLFGGRAAEEIIFNDITTGASNDIEKASKIARNMVMKYGMSTLGPIKFGNENEEVFLGKDINNSRNYSEEIATSIDNEVNNLINTCYEKAKQILTENIEILHKTANLLLEKEKISGDEFRSLFKQEDNEENNENI